MDLLNYEDEMICPTCNAVGRIKKRDKRVSDLSIPEYKKLWIECYEEMEQHKLNKSKVEEVFLKDGKPIPKEY